MKGIKWIVWIVVLVTLCMVGGPVVLADGGGSDAIVGEDFVLESGDVWNHDLFSVGGHLTLEEGSVVNGNVAITGGEATLSGEINGDVVAFGGTVELTSSAVVQGDLVVFGTVRQHPGAVVQGNTVHGLDATKKLSSMPWLLDGQWMGLPGTDSSGAQPRANGALGVLRGLLILLMVLLIAFLAETLLPRNVQIATQAMTNTWAITLGAGLLTAVLLVVLVPILVILCIGIPVAVVLLIAFVVCALLGWTAAGHVIGVQIAHAVNWQGRSPLFAPLLGTGLITLLALVPCIGWLVVLGGVSWGVGAIVLTRLGTTVYPPSTFAAPQQGASASGGSTGIPASGPKRRTTRRLDSSATWSEPRTDGGHDTPQGA